MTHHRATAGHDHHTSHGPGGADGSHGPGGLHGSDDSQERMAELVDLDAEVLASYLSQVTTWVAREAAGLRVRTILDLGSGTGTGTLALLPVFERADAVAVDVSPSMLDRLRQKASGVGLAGRVRTVQADLDVAWPPVGTVELVWASSSLHHLADPGRVLGDVLAALAPGGLLVVAEMGSFPRFLPDDVGLGRPGLEARLHAVLDELRARDLPTLGSDWGATLSAAGFTVEAERTFEIDLRPPLPAAAARYAQASLRRARAGVDGRLDAADLAALDTLVEGDGPDGVLRRGDLTVTTERQVWLARRP